MGMAIPVLIGAAVGLGASALFGRSNGFMGGGSFTPQITDQNFTQAAQAAMTPIDTEMAINDGKTNNPLMEEERSKEQAAAALRNEQAQGVLTSGLGLTTDAATQKKGLLGA